MDYVLTTNALSKEYGTFKALNAVSMHIPKGAIYGFVRSEERRVGKEC